VARNVRLEAETTAPLSGIYWAEEPLAGQLAIDRLKALFGAEHANVQPNSGSQANQAVFFGSLRPGDTIVGMSLTTARSALGAVGACRNDTNDMARPIGPRPPDLSTWALAVIRATSVTPRTSGAHERPFRSCRGPLLRRCDGSRWTKAPTPRPRTRKAGYADTPQVSGEGIGSLRRSPIRRAEPCRGFARPSTSHRCKKARGERFLGVQRVLHELVGCHVYYRVRPRLRRVEILAVWHAHRGAAPRL